MLNSTEVHRGKTYCRGCSSTTLFSALDLGELPIANELWNSAKELVELFPLHLRICTSCGLGQVEDVVAPTRLFNDYRYLSSTSSSFLDHAKNYASRMCSELNLGGDSWVLEIASNDGYLLKNFVALGVTALGIEPAENVAKIALAEGVPCLNEFFSSDLARELLILKGHPRLIIANNVMAHVPDLKDFLTGMRILAGPATVISIENPSMMNLLHGDQFDTIYHEHFSYLTAHSVQIIARDQGLELFNIESITTHGGSNRYWLQLSGANKYDNSKVARFIEKELESGLLNQTSWVDFKLRIVDLLHNFRNWIESANNEGRTVCGYGAAAKASTLLNASSVELRWLKAIADESNEKQNRYMPAAGIPILNPKLVFEFQPTDIIIFPWNIAPEIASKIRNTYKSEIRIWRVVPKMELVS